MNQAHESDAQFEQFLRDDARRERRAAPRDLQARVTAEIRERAAGRRPVAKHLARRWYRAALAAGIVIAATLVAAAMFRQTPLPYNTAPVEALADARPTDEATAGPMALFASLQRTPDDIGLAIREAVSREMHLLIEDIRLEQQQFVARLPLQGRIDHDAERLPAPN